MTLGTIFCIAFLISFLVIEFQRSKMRIVTFNEDKFGLSAKALKQLNEDLENL